MSDSLDYYIQKLVGINKKLGGTEEQMGNKKATEFDNLKFVIHEKLHDIKQKQQERDKKVDRDKNSVDIITLRHEIKMNLDEIKELLSQMGRILVKQARNPKKFPKSELELHQSVYENLQRDFQMVNNIEYGEGYANEDDNRVKRLSELKKDLWERRDIELEDIRIDANEEELQAMDEFKKKDKVQDEYIGRINNGLVELKPKVQQMGEKIDFTRVQIQKNEKEMDIVNSELMTQNQRLKKIIREYRAPSKFCLDIVMVLIILGLIGTVVSMIKD